MLLASTTDALDPPEIKPLAAKAVQHAVEGLQPQRDRGEDLMLGLMGDDALLDGKAGGVGVEVEFGNVLDLQLGVDNQPLELLGREVEANVQGSLRHEGHNRGAMEGIRSIDGRSDLGRGEWNLYNQGMPRLDRKKNLTIDWI